MLSGIIGPLLDKALSYIPDPEQRANAKRELAIEASRAQNDFRQFVIDYEGRGDQVHPAVQIYRSSVRPTITYGAAIGLGLAIWSNQPVDIIDMIFKLNLLTLSFWFGSKALERLGFNKDVAKDLFKK